VNDWQYERLKQDVTSLEKRVRWVERYACGVEEWQRLLPLRVARGIAGVLAIGAVGAVIGRTLQH
jgi:hypothetical protein